MPERSKDWINLAKSDLNAAEALLDGGSFVVEESSNSAKVLFESDGK
ncbi:MAG: hypothetical protein ACLFVA_03700 [Dehalococcoidia bacterium]